MKRIRILAVSIAAVAAIAALSATSASAQPTWWECSKAEKIGKEFNGNYNDNLCTSENAEGKGKYVLQPGAKNDRRFKGKSGPAVLHVKTWLGDAKVECAHSSDSSIPQSPNLLIDVEVTFKHCIALGNKKLKCSSAGKKPGEVRLHAMSGELGYIQESPAVVGVRLELESEPGGVIGSFSCGRFEASISGALVGVVQRDVNTVDKEIEFVFATGERLGTVEYEGHEFAPLVNLLGFEGEEGPPHLLRAELCGALIEEEIGATCAPEAFAGEDQTVTAKSEALMLKA